MKNALFVVTLALAAILAITSSASADFTGQTILGPIGPGSSVFGDTTNSTDDNDGWYSGTHIFYLWEGPDDVWQLDWPGGDMGLEMTYDNTSIDLDLFLYTAGSPDESILDSYLNTGVENISYAAAPAGTYYVLIDGYLGAGPYQLTVTPEPGSLLLLAMGTLLLVRRSRKA
jgi:hypothetical protein